MKEHKQNVDSKPITRERKPMTNQRPALALIVHLFVFSASSSDGVEENFHPSLSRAAKPL